MLHAIDPLHVVIELARATETDDPFAPATGRQDYVLRVQGGGYRQVSLDWNEQLSGLLDRVRLPGRDPEDVARLGNVLRRFLTEGDWPDTADDIHAALQAGREVILTVRSAAAELFTLPFELLTMRSSGAHLGELPGVLLRYAWPETHSTPEARTPRLDDGRILVAWSSAGGRVPAAAHVDAIAAAAQRGHYSFDRDRDVVEGVSLRALEAALSDPSAPRVSVLHLLAHGAETGSAHGLVLDDGEGGRTVVEPSRLRQVLAPHAGELRLVVLAACDSANTGGAGSNVGSVAQALHRGGLQAVVGSRFPLSVDGSIRMTRRLYRELLVPPRSLEDAVRAARQALTEGDGRLDWAAIQLYAREEDGLDTRPIIIRPYRGLLPFGPEHTRFFFGRDAERKEILDDLNDLEESGRPRFLVVAGASGTGKSSVVLSGAVPDLTGARADQDEAPAAAEKSDQELTRTVQRLETLASRYDVPAMREGMRLLRGLAVKLAQEGVGMDWVRIRPGNEPLAALQRAMTARPSEDRRYLIVVDQFEELFTHGHAPERRDDFCRRLWQLAGGTTGVSIVCTIRVDFIGHCGQVVLDEEGLRLDQIAYDEAHRVFVAQMAKSSLRACIEAPARRVGLALEPGLAARLLEDVRAEPGALPVLSYTLDLLWQKRTGSRLTAAAYEALGGLAGALERKADEVFDSLDTEHQRQARRLLVRLVGSGEDGARDTRRQLAVERARPGNAAESALFDEVLRELVNRRLLVRSDEGGASTVEVAHEALIRKWQRLRKWVDQDRDMLAELDEIERFVTPWQQYGTLLDGDQLGYARKVVQKYPDDVSTEVRNLIHESGAARTRQERIKWALVAAVMLVVSGLGGWGWISRGQAVEMQQSALAAKAQTVDEVVRLTWRAAGLLELPDNGYVGGVRDIAAHVSKVVNLRKLNSVADTPVFLRGPHTDDIDLRSEAFGHYNPAFLDWALEHAIPAADDPAFRKETQAFYDDTLREAARVYLRIGRDVDQAARTERAQFQRSAKALDLGNSYAHAAVDDLKGADWVSYNAAYHAYVANAFWMRREADGTREQFLALAERLVQTYDRAHYRSLPKTAPGLKGRVAQQLVGTWQPRRGGVSELRFQSDGTWSASDGTSGAWSIEGIESAQALRVDGQVGELDFMCCDQGISLGSVGTLPGGNYTKVNTP